MSDKESGASCIVRLLHKTGIGKEMDSETWVQRLLEKAPTISVTYEDIVGKQAIHDVKKVVEKVTTVHLEKEIREMEYGLYIKPDGTVIHVKPKKVEIFASKELRSFVGGNMEYVSFTDDLNMYIKDESLLDGLPLNAKATALW